ncbi:MAG: glycosyltransferase family 1 protein, partial [Alphaproteobacteria bacterium]
RYIPITVPRIIYPIQTIIFSIKVAKLLSKFHTFDLIETHHDAGLVPLLLQYLWRKKPYKIWVEFIHGVFLDEFYTIKQNNLLFSKAVIRASALLPLSCIEKLAARSSDEVIAVSNYAARKIVSLYSIPESKIHVIPNGIDKEVFFNAHAKQIPICPELTVPIRKFLFVGRLDPRKGILVLIKAFAKALKTYPLMELNIIGMGMQREDAWVACQTLNIKEYVHFLGKRSDKEIAEAYRSAYAVCMPSFQEGQGITALEAQACGTPVLASNAGGLPEVVLDGQTGVLINSDDSDSFASAISEFAYDIYRRNQMGKYAQRWSRHFFWDIQLKKAFDLYQKLIASD